MHLVTHSNLVSLAVSVPLSMAVYGLLIILFQVVTVEELPDMPFGMRILRLCQKVGLM